MNTEQKRQKFLKIVEKNGSSFMGLVFLKKDGSPRDARFNPRDFNEIKGTGKPCTDPNIFRFREVHNKEEKKTVWRSFHIDRLVSVTSKGEQTVFQ
jgi:hypothetical protein